MCRYYLIMLSVLLVPFSSTLAQPGNAETYIQFIEEPDADSSTDCNQRGGLRISVINKHPDRIIDLQLDRYFAEVRQPGRSMFALRNGHKLALGCNIVMDSRQRWELLNASFISESEAVKRYGTIY